MLCVIQAKENEISYGDGHNSIAFCDLFEKIICIIYKYSLSFNNCFNMITKDLLLITGVNKLYIIKLKT